jgi:hypothetical protein
VENKKRWEKYRYEFMRRDPEYLKAWAEITELRKQAQYPPEYKEEAITSKGVKTIVFPYWGTQAGIKERYYCVMFNYLRRMIDPSISYDQLNNKHIYDLRSKSVKLIGGTRNIKKYLITI